MMYGSVLYFAGLAFAEILRLPQRIARSRSGQIRETGPDLPRTPERAVLAGIVIGLWVLPGAYAFTDHLGFADYRIPAFVSWIGAAVFVAGLVIRSMAHRALGRHWSHTLEIREGHRIVTDGIYAYLRHPIYSSLIFWAIAQPLLLQNMIAGFSGPVAVALLWIIRVPREEAMMLKEFGEEYAHYMARTGRVFPARIAKVTKPG
jgi:protein-S-isoprenylcysteine O-methyltransferase Ste14